MEFIKKLKDKLGRKRLIPKSNNFAVDFRFIDNTKLRGIIVQYHREAIKAFENELYAAALFLSGAVLEGMLTWALEKAQLPESSDQDLYKFGLAKLIDQAVKLEILGKDAKPASWSVKDFRDYIHPGILVREERSGRADFARASSALSAVMEISRSLTGRIGPFLGAEVDITQGQISIDSSEAMRRLNFEWLISGKVAGCRGPQTDEDLNLLASLGVKAIIRLAHIKTDEIQINTDQVKNAGLEDFHEPVLDFRAPTLDQANRVLAFIDSALDRNLPVAISCGAGYGRTSTLLACYLVYNMDMVADEAIKEVQRACHREPEVGEQIQFIYDFESAIKNKPS